MLIQYLEAPGNRAEAASQVVLAPAQPLSQAVAECP